MYHKPRRFISPGVGVVLCFLLPSQDLRCLSAAPGRHHPSGTASSSLFFCFLLLLFLLLYIQSWNGSGPAASSSHGVRHPVDHVHHGESEREHSPGVDVDGVGIDGLAHALGAALLFLLLLGLLRLPGPSPPGLRLLAAAASALSWDLTAGALGPPMAIGNHHALVHSGDG